MSLIHLSTELRQELKLTPQLLQSMEVLQMNSQELLDYLNQVSEENPLVEQSDLSQLHSAYEALRQNPLPALAYFMERFLPGFHLTLDELQGSGDEIFGQTTIDLTSGKEGTQL